MSNHPNRAHTEAPAMSFEQQVARVLDSLTKELPMSEPPTGPLDAANEYAAPPRHVSSLATTVIPTVGLTFREAADRVRELLNWNDVSARRDSNDDGAEAGQRQGQKRGKTAPRRSHSRHALRDDRRSAGQGRADG